MHFFCIYSGGSAAVNIFLWEYLELSIFFLLVYPKQVLLQAIKPQQQKLFFLKNELVFFNFCQAHCAIRQESPYRAGTSESQDHFHESNVQQIKSQIQYQTNFILFNTLQYSVSFIICLLFIFTAPKKSTKSISKIEAVSHYFLVIN